MEIKDSGHRREFETGAVRDMAEGKGRYDLLDWQVIHEMAVRVEKGARYDLLPWDMIHEMAERAAAGARYDLMPWDAVHELEQHCRQGAQKYGERNCEKGIYINSLMDSALRHASAYMRGMDDEPHIRASLWNLAYTLWMTENKPEMQNLPVWTEKKESTTHVVSIGNMTTWSHRGNDTWVCDACKYFLPHVLKGGPFKNGLIKCPACLRKITGTIGVDSSNETDL